MNTPEKIIVAVTGASGAIYARLTVEALLAQPSVREIALITTLNGQAVADHEGATVRADDTRVRRFRNDDMFAPPASGSSDYDAMVAVPCSAGFAGRVAGGVSGTLAERAADVMLKERRPLIMVLRETPLGLVHLRNLTALAESGAVVMPACPSFYSRPESIEGLCRTVTDRVLRTLGFRTGYRWGAETE